VTGGRAKAGARRLRGLALVAALAALSCGEGSDRGRTLGPAAVAAVSAARAPHTAAAGPAFAAVALPGAERFEPAVLGDRVIVVDGGTLRAFVGAGDTAPATVAFAPDERPSSPVVRREPLAVDAAEIFVSVATAAGCELRAYTRALAPAWSRAVAGACVQPGVAAGSLLWPVADAFGPRVERLDPMTGAWLGAVALPAQVVAPAARVGDGSARWVYALTDGVALIDASDSAQLALLDVAPLADLAPTSALAPGGPHVAVTARHPGDPAGAHLGTRIQRLVVTPDGALEPVGAPIVTPRVMEAAAIGASPDCTVRTGGSHWWCGGGGFIATGGSHWLGGFDLATGATLFDVAPPQTAIQSLSLGADGRIYTGGSHWLGGFEVHAFDPLVAPNPAAFELVFARPDAPAAVLPSLAFTCAERAALLVDPGAGAAELVFTDAFATAAPPGTWARAFGGGDNAGNAASPDACEAPGPAPVCGDGVLDPGEACDDGNALDEPDDAEVRCSADCRVERQLVSAAVPLPLSDLVGGPFKSVRSVRVRYLSRGARVYGELCAPAAAGPFPVLLVSLEGPQPVGHVWASELCGFAASQGAVVAFTQPRGRGADTDWPSGGGVEVCRGEIDDLRGLASIARAEPTAIADRVGAFGAGFGACTVAELALRGPGAPDDPTWPGLGAAVLAASATDPAALHARHAAFPPPAKDSALIVQTLEGATGGTPDEAPVAYALRTPIEHAQALFDAGTAVMLVQATGDPTWPLAQTCALRSALQAAGATFFDAQVSANAPLYLAAEFVAFPACPDMNFATADPNWANVDYALLALQDTGTYEFTQLGMAAIVQRMVDFFQAHASQ
jgi:cysteine-rich repeat protein